MFLPTTMDEVRARGWKRLDVVLVTGDAYIDAPHIGIAVIGKVLLAAGFKVGIIAQPDTEGGEDIGRLGEPELFWGVTAGCMDSMVANYTALNKRRRTDDLTAGGRNTKRPDRATIVYCNLVRRFFKSTRPLVIGGLEASLRRISHYDYLSDSVRRAIMVDARADVLVYGMAERTIVTLARRLAAGRPVTDIRGICFLSATPPEGFIELPSHEAVSRDRKLFVAMHRLLYDNSDPVHGQGLFQLQDTRYLVQNPPQEPLAAEELDAVHGLDFERDVHPFHRNEGPVRCLETIRFSIITHQGCFGGCRFCAIAVHQGRRVVSRSEAGILEEAARLSEHPEFKGYIQDLGGPTANMYGMACSRPAAKGACRKRHCLFPDACRYLDLSHAPQVALLQQARRLPNVKKVVIGSGIRHDLVLADKACGERYLEAIVRHHTSGQLKVAPEHATAAVLKLMGKPGPELLLDFKARFEKLCRSHGLDQYLTCYLMAAHPGCTLKDMESLRRFVDLKLGFRPEQVQIFTPTPGTWSTVMYHTGLDPESGEPIYVERKAREKQRQKAVLRPPEPQGHPRPTKGRRRRPPSTLR